MGGWSSQSICGLLQYMRLDVTGCRGKVGSLVHSLAVDLLYKVMGCLDGETEQSRTRPETIPHHMHSHVRPGENLRCTKMCSVTDAPPNDLADMGRNQPRGTSSRDAPIWL